MRVSSRIAAMFFMGMILSASAAQAWHVDGYVRCDANGNGVIDTGDLPLGGVVVTVVGTSLPFTASTTTDSAGAYRVNLPDIPGGFTVSIVAPANAAVLVPAANPFAFVTTDDEDEPEIDFLVHRDACAQQACWLTGGGAKFSSITGTLVAEKGPQHSFGGNVNPGCNPDSGEGGQWNHVAHSAKLHFMGTAIEVVACGNVVPPPPPGSESPVTPFNFIEYKGVGTLKGIQGNKADYGTVWFEARAEDRNEPGSSGAKDGTLIDRYYIRVYNGSGNLLVVDGTGSAYGAGNPVPITHGNLQIHISSCTTAQ